MEQENSAQPHILRELAPVFGAESLGGSDASGTNGSSSRSAATPFDTNCTTTTMLRGGKDSGGVKQAAPATAGDHEDVQQSHTAPYQAPPRQLRAPQRQASVMPTVVPTEFVGAENSDLPASAALVSAAMASRGGKAATTTIHDDNTNTNTNVRAQHSPPSSGPPSVKVPDTAGAPP
ncbi:unnamed protein product, partial [Laminaria digitata]